MTAFSSTLAVQEFDQSLREFSAPTPAELYRILSTYNPQQESRSPLDSNRIDELEKKGREFLSSLTPEQQEQAWQFAKKYLGKNGVDSLASKALMDQFGVPDELQENLAEQFKALQSPDGQDFSSFKDTVRQATEKALEQARQQENGSSGNQNAKEPASEKPFDSTTRNRNPSATDEPVTEPSSTDPSATDPSATDPSATGRSATGQPERDQANPNPLNPNQPDQGASNDGPANRAPTADGNSKTPSKNSPTGIPKPGKDRNRDESLGQDPFQQFNQPDTDSEPSIPERSGASEASESQLGSQFDWEQKLRELLGREKGPGQSAKGDGPSQGNGAQSESLNTDSQTQSKILEELEKIASKGSSSFNKNLLERIGETLSGSTNESAVPKERLTARIDRLLVDAAKRSLESKSGNGPDFDMPNSVDSVFDKFIDKVHNTVTNKNRSNSSSSKPSLQKQDWRASNNNNNNRQSAPSTDERSRGLVENVSIPSPRSTNPSDQPIDISSSGGGNLFETFRGLPKLEPKHALTFVAVVGLVLFLAYLLMRTLANDETTVRAGKFGKRFRNAKIRSPEDLVEAVDHFLIIKFGSDSRWWNAKHAQNILCAGAPEFRAKISELIKDYVRVRYMRADVLLSESEQQRHKTILQELSKLAEKPVMAAATETEG